MQCYKYTYYNNTYKTRNRNKNIYTRCFVTVSVVKNSAPIILLTIIMSESVDSIIKHFCNPRVVLKMRLIHPTSSV